MSSINTLPTGVARHTEAVIASNQVIRNTYLLLSMTLLFAAATAGAAVALGPVSSTPPTLPQSDLV